MSSSYQRLLLRFQRLMWHNPNNFEFKIIVINSSLLEKEKNCFRLSRVLNIILLAEDMLA